MGFDLFLDEIAAFICISGGQIVNEKSVSIFLIKNIRSTSSSSNCNKTATILGIVVLCLDY